MLTEATHTSLSPLSQVGHSSIPKASYDSYYPVDPLYEFQALQFYAQQFCWCAEMGLPEPKPERMVRAAKDRDYLQRVNEALTKASAKFR